MQCDLVVLLATDQQPLMRLVNWENKTLSLLSNAAELQLSR